MIPGKFDFRMRGADDSLAGFVSTVWYARGRTPHGRERILPSTGAVLLVVLGPPLRMTEPTAEATLHEVSGAWLTGPHERPILNDPTAETYAVGAVFEPGGIGAWMEGPVDPLANRIAPLGDVIPTLDLGAAFQERLRSAPEPEAALDALAHVLGDTLRRPADHDRWADAIRQLTDPEAGGVAEVQAALGVSRRHFTDEIRRRVGLRPKSLQRIARMRRLLEELDARKPVRWAEEAIGAGYFDQPHAIREFRTFTGMTPTEYVRRRQQAWGHDGGPGEAANFIPEIIR